MFCRFSNGAELVGPNSTRCGSTPSRSYPPGGVERESRPPLSRRPSLLPPAHVLPQGYILSFHSG
jgi:hypothetical protein